MSGSGDGGMKAAAMGGEPPPKYGATPGEMVQLDKVFTYHETKNDQLPRYQRIRSQAKDLALTMLRDAPPSRERSLAMTKLEEAVMWANAAIARNE